MQFPRINAAINITLLYYNKHQIVNGVGILSGFFSPVKHTFNDVELPNWHQMVLNAHSQMEDEIKQIISLNYPYVQSIVFEDLRGVLNDYRIKTLQKEIIIKIADDQNAEELHRVATKHPNGFAVTVNKDFLPDYFKIVEYAISNLKRIINKYLSLYDNNKLPSSFPLPSYIPASNTPLVSDKINKLEMDITTEQLALLFRLFDEVGLLKYKQKKDMQKFLFDYIQTKTDSSNFKYLINKFSDIDKAAKTFWKDKLAEMQKVLSIKLK